MKTTTLTPTHPGLILQRGLRDLGLPLTRVARDTRIPLSTLSAIVRAKRPISPENAIRLSRYLNTSPRYWTNLQSDYDLRLSLSAHGPTIDHEVSPHSSAA